LRFLVIISLAFLLISCTEVEPSRVAKLQGRWEAIDASYTAFEFDQSVVRVEKVSTMGTDQCGTTRWNTIKEVFNYRVTYTGIKTNDIGTYYQTTYECDSTVVHFWTPGLCSGNQKYDISFQAKDLITIFCASDTIETVFRKVAR